MYKGNSDYEGIGTNERLVVDPEFQLQIESIMKKALQSHLL